MQAYLVYTHMLHLLAALTVAGSQDAALGTLPNFATQKTALVLEASITNGCLVHTKTFTVLFGGDRIRFVEGRQERAVLEDGTLKIHAQGRTVPVGGRVWSQRELSTPEGFARLVNAVLAPDASFSAAARNDQRWTAGSSAAVTLIGSTAKDLDIKHVAAMKPFVAKAQARESSLEKWRLTSVEYLGKPMRFLRLRYTESYGRGGGFAGGNSLNWTATASLKSTTN